MESLVLESVQGVPDAGSSCASGSGYNPESGWSCSCHLSPCCLCMACLSPLALLPPTPLLPPLLQCKQALSSLQPVARIMVQAGPVAVVLAPHCCFGHWTGAAVGQKHARAEARVRGGGVNRGQRLQWWRDEGKGNRGPRLRGRGDK